MNVVGIAGLMASFLGAGIAPGPNALATKCAPDGVVAVQSLAPEFKLCTLNVVGVETTVVLQSLSSQAKINLILLTPSTEKLVLQLKDVPFIDMLRHICAVTNLQYLKVGNTYILAKEDQLKSAYPKEWEVAHPAPANETPLESALVTEILRTNYVSSSQIAASLEKLFDKGVLSAVAGPVQTNPSIAEQQTASSTGSAASVLQRDASSAENSGRTLVLRGPASIVQEAVRLARQLDSPRPQVGIEVTISDVSDSGLKELGISWTFGPVNLTEVKSSGLRFGSLDRNAMTFSGIIKALEKNDQAKLLASPNISVLDGERAFILIGDRINFPVLIGYSQANTPIFDKKEERVGIYLQVAASVSSDDEITLSVYPQVSTVTGFLEVNGASYPQISTREAQTTLRIRSGETCVIGGLLKSEEIGQLEKVPILGHIPILGELFTRRKRTKAASQVLISLKPQVIRPDESR